jgi:hypothetical protein
MLTGSWQSSSRSFTFTGGSLSGFNIRLNRSTNSVATCPPNGSLIKAALQQDLKTLKGSITCGQETDSFELVR